MRVGPRGKSGGNATVEWELELKGLLGILQNAPEMKSGELSFRSRDRNCDRGSSPDAGSTHTWDNSIPEPDPKKKPS